MYVYLMKVGAPAVLCCAVQCIVLLSTRRPHNTKRQQLLANPMHNMLVNSWMSSYHS